MAAFSANAIVISYGLTIPADGACKTATTCSVRAKAYNLSVEQYKRNNLLRTEVASKDVAELAAELCGPLFSKTTGAQIPVDGGNERVV